MTESFITCELGHSHWGTFGASGLLLRAGSFVLLQHRSPAVHEGGCWGIPGGAMSEGEDVVAAALRETEEELGCDLPPATIGHRTVLDHGGWAYTTVVGQVRQRFSLPSSYGWETGPMGFKWFRVDDVDGLELHSGLRAVWHEVAT